MSYTISYFLQSNIVYPRQSNDATQLKKQGFVLASKLRKGMNVEIGVDRQEGDDSDGLKKQVVTISKVTKLKCGEVKIEFDGSQYHDEVPQLSEHCFYKVQ